MDSATTNAQGAAMWAGKPIARRKPLKRSKTHLNSRTVFKAHGSNPLKTYHRKYTDAQVTAWAQEKRRERLANPTEAESALRERIRSWGIPFESEYIIQNGDRFVLLDVYLPNLRVCIEIDGEIHARQSEYDRGRDKWLQECHGIRTTRFSNDQVLKRPQEVIDILNQIHLTQTKETQ